MPDAIGRAGDWSLSPGQLRELRAHAGPDGRVTLEALERVVPVEQLSTEALARTVTQLEDAGLEIVLPPELQRPRRGVARPATTAEAAPEPAADRARAPSESGARAAMPAPTAPRAPAREQVDPEEWRGTAIAAGILVTVCVILMGVFGALA
jgi:hypothetical protein